MARFIEGDSALLIDFEGEVVGSVSAHWEDRATRWLELGIVLYSDQHWGKKIGRRALTLWLGWWLRVD